MKTLILDDPSKHNAKGLIGETFCSYIELRKGGTVLVSNKEEAHSELSQDDFGLVIIHHSGFRDVDSLKKRHPKLKYACYSANIYIDPSPGSIGEEFNNKMLEHYDYLIPWSEIPETLDRIVLGK